MSINNNNYNGRRVGWGIIIITVGVLILLHTTGVYDFGFNWARYLWPLALIIPGINLAVGRRNPQANNALMMAAVVVLFVLTLAFNRRNGFARTDSYNTLNHTRHGVKHNNDNNDNNDDEGDYDEDEKPYKSMTLAEPLDTALSRPKILNLNIAAGDLKFSTSTDSLLEAHIKGKNPSYTLTKAETDSATTLTLRSNSNKGLVSKSEDMHLDLDADEVKLALNKKALWHLNYAGGVSAAELDLRDIRVRNFDYKGGVGTLTLQLGGLLPITDVHINAGISAVKLQIPEKSGCRIISKAGLSSENFPGFVARGDNIYETQNYSTSPQKVFIFLSGGLSSFEVKRVN